jgi:hypothetical protein
MEAEVSVTRATRFKLDQAKAVLTNYRHMVEAYGLSEANSERDDAWQLLREHAGRLKEGRFPRHTATPGDAA